MSYSQLYLPSSIPQWGIFLGIVFVIVGYVEKKTIWSTSGWIVLVLTGLVSLYYNFSGELTAVENVPATVLTTLKSTNLLCAMGSALAAMTLVFQYTKRKSYRILAVLTLIYFMLIFFQFNYITRSQKMTEKSSQTSEQIK